MDICPVAVGVGAGLVRAVVEAAGDACVGGVLDEPERRGQAGFEAVDAVADRVLRELLAAQSGWSALRRGATLDEARELAHIEASRHEGTEKETVPENGLLDLLMDSLEAADPQRVGDSSKPPMVHPPGLEPGTH